MRFALWSLTLFLAGCRTGDSPGEKPGEKPAPPSALAPSPAASTAPAPTTPAPTPTAPTPATPAATPDDRAVRWQRYAARLTQPDAPCDSSYGVILSVAWPSQNSRLAWLAELLRIEPEFAERISKEGPTQLFAAVYGPRNYGRGTDTSDLWRLALTVSCTDHELCRSLAGLYASIDPNARTELYCGPLPGRSGGDFPVDLAALTERPRSHPHGTCARYRACLARLDRPVASCDGFEKSATRCADEPDCEKALACFDAEPRNPKKPLWSDAPGPSGSFY